MGRVRLISNAEEMLLLGRQLAEELKAPQVVALSGPLGAGKTTLVQGIALGLGVKEPVQSPTFVLLNVYEKLAHFDLYRLKGVEDFVRLGFDSYLEEFLCLIEWPERIASILPKETLHIRLSHVPEGRLATFS